MSSIQDTIKALKEADEKIEKAVKLEESAVTIQRDAARLRDETRDDLTKINQAREQLATAQSKWQSESQLMSDELKNREVTLVAGQADLERKTAEGNDGFKLWENELRSRTVALEKSEKLVNEKHLELDAVGKRYKSIADFINEIL